MLWNECAISKRGWTGQIECVKEVVHFSHGISGLCLNEMASCVVLLLLNKIRLYLLHLSKNGQSRMIQMKRILDVEKIELLLTKVLTDYR